MLRYAIYCRVSTDTQEKDGTSLDTQERDCRAFVERLGGTVVTCVREAASGYSLGRPGLTELRQTLREGGIDVFLCHAVDRLARQQNHMGVLFDEIQAAGVRLEFVLEQFENTAMGRFILSARAFIAEVEREKIVERTTRGKLLRAQQGQLVQGTGRGLYGYVLSARGRGGDGRRRIHAAQAAVVARIFHEFVAGRSVHAISQGLNADGIETLQGWETTVDGRRLRQITWYPLTVRRILQNESYTGRTTYRRTTITMVTDARTGKRQRKVVDQPETEWVDVPGATPAIISRELWEQAQQVFSTPPHRQRTGERLYPYPLSGHARCVGCQGTLTGSTLSGGTGRQRSRYYGCRNRNLPDRSARCPSRYVRAETLERRLVAGLSRVLADPAEIVSAYNYLNAHGTDVDSGALERARARVASAEQQVRQLARLARFADDDDAADALAEELKLAVREKKTAQDALRRLETRQRPLPQLTADPEQLAALSARVAAWLDPTDVEKLKLALEGLEVTVWAGTGEPYAIGSLPVHATCEQNSHADVCAMVA